MGKEPIYAEVMKRGRAKGRISIRRLQEAVVSLTGDCWVAGRHRIICGDTTDIETIEELMNGDRADLVFTDPPFNVDYHGGRGRSRRRIANDNLGSGFEAFLGLLAGACCR
jgi:DNA modification methylase